MKRLDLDRAAWNTLRLAHCLVTVSALVVNNQGTIDMQLRAIRRSCAPCVSASSMYHLLTPEDGHEIIARRAVHVLTEVMHAMEIDEGHCRLAHVLERICHRHG